VLPEVSSVIKWDIPVLELLLEQLQENITPGHTLLAATRMGSPPWEGE
jgi:hypothetical protein